MKKGFTLAETLITLGIVGIVAVMTLPSVIQKQHEKETVAKVKKAYSVLSQAYLMATNEFGTFDQWGITTGMNNSQSHIIFGNNMKKFMKLSRDCVGMSDADTDKNCPLKDSSAGTSSYYSRVVLSNGSLITFRMYSNSCKSAYATSGKKDTCGIIRLYTNPTAKTQKGKNAFDFFLTKNAIVPEGTQNATHQFNKACNKTITEPYPSYSGDNMYACTAWVIYNENMDYWHCDDLDWNTKTKCK